jgi:hypothetical protein
MSEVMGMNVKPRTELQRAELRMVKAEADYFEALTSLPSETPSPEDAALCVGSVVAAIIDYAVAYDEWRSMLPNSETMQRPKGVL